jgi:hypothetical protein
MRRQQLICAAICLALLVYRAWHDVNPSSLQRYFDFSSSVDHKLAFAGDDDASFTTLFSPDDHVISVPSIPIDCSRLLVVMTELSAVSRLMTVNFVCHNPQLPLVYTIQLRDVHGL